MCAGDAIRPGQEDPQAPAPWGRYPDPQAGALDIAGLAAHGAQGRGVMIDLEHHIGRQRQAVGYDALMRILEADGVAVESGDMVCLHTGFADTLLAMNRPMKSLKVAVMLAVVYLPLLALLTWQLGLVGAGIARVLGEVMPLAVVTGIVMRTIGRHIRRVAERAAHPVAQPAQ